ncbi:MAG TPA: response regulator transcription factor [Gaiellaceae bacterium]|nr:response regulator transcription factor [Gaiellaceae bacterium]
MSEPRDAAVTCLLADDHPPVVEFLSRYLSQHGITITASTRDGAEALRRIEETRPAVAVLDVRMPRISGVEVARRLAAASSPTRVILYTGYGDRTFLADAIDAGVAGLVDKESPLDDLVRAVRIVAGGDTYIDPGLGAILLAVRSGRVPTLTPRERDVLRLLADGCSNDVIAKQLSISGQTVRTHVQKAMERLGATTRTQAVATALREALIS